MEFSGKTFHLNLRLENIGSRLWLKSIAIVYRLLAYFKLLPIRFKRLVIHLYKGLLFLNPSRLYKRKSKSSSSQINRITSWYLDVLCYSLDLLGIPEIYETYMDIVKFNTRPLYDWEIQEAKSVFGETIDYRRVRIDELSFAGPRQKRFCYVSFYIINSWGPMQNSTFIHEMTHVWQFEKMGSIYIPHALRAQQSQMGYNYGGVDVLKDCQEKGKRFLSFNFEQQGDIISDYYRIKDGYKPHWGNGTRHDLPVYESFINQMREM